MASCFLTLSDEESKQKINIDELYERTKARDMKQLSIFEKILGRVHTRIDVVSKNRKVTVKHIFFQVPEYIFGESLYDKGHCIAFIMAKLEENGFDVRYIHPNTLFVSWENWVPSYMRNEIKKKMGIVIDERGNVVKKEAEIEEKQPDNQKRPKEKQFNSTKNYKPTGNLLYDKELFEKIEKKVSFV
jgi:hypothetical protein